MSRRVCHDAPMTRRGVAWTAAAVATLWLLAGCVKLDMDVKVRSDNKVDGTVVLAVDKSVITATGASAQQFRDQLRTQGPFSGADKPSEGFFSQRPYDSGGKIGETYTFSGVPLSEFAGKDSGLTIQRKGDRFLVSGVIDLVGSSGIDPQQGALGKSLGKSAETRIRMTFPGEVLHSNGKIDGRSVTWHPKLGEKTPLTAEARITAVFPVLIAVGGGVALFVLVVGALLLFLFLRRRRASVAPAGAYPAGPAYGWGQPQQPDPDGTAAPSGYASAPPTAPYAPAPSAAAPDMTMPLPAVPPAAATPPQEPFPPAATPAEPTQVIRTNEPLPPAPPQSPEESR